MPFFGEWPRGGGGAGMCDHYRHRWLKIGAIGMALGARLKIDSLEKEIAEGLLYPETPATRSVVFSGTSVPDAAASTLASPDDFGRERGRVLSRTG